MIEIHLIKPLPDGASTIIAEDSIVRHKENFLYISEKFVTYMVPYSNIAAAIQRNYYED